MFFVHMIARLHGGVSFAQFNPFFRVNFKVNAFKMFNACKGEHFTHDFVNQYTFTKRKFFCYPLVRKAI